MKNIEFKTIKNNSEAEIVEKKSRFIANVFSVSSKKEAEEKIAVIKKKYYDAKHSCYAFSVLEENGSKYQKCSDDGEPSGTAGEPILNIINKNELNNILIIVTRYFGGILLGTGGLCRDYSEASIKALSVNEIVTMQSGLKAEIVVQYEDNSNFKNYCEKNNINVVNCKYEQDITYIIELNDEKYENLQKSILAKNILKSNNDNIIKEICRKYVEKHE